MHHLLDAARQHAPQCLLTFTNYPSTEFLLPGPLDFFCFNVYLEDPQRLGAVPRPPASLGRHRAARARRARDRFDPPRRRRPGAVGPRQLRRVFDHGLAGSFVFSFTDDWFAGGVTVRDWAFGLTDHRRGEKPAAEAARGGVGVGATRDGGSAA